MIAEPHVWHIPVLTRGPAAHWEQASVLVQVGLLDPERFPVAGVEQANRLLALAQAPATGG